MSAWMSAGVDWMGPQPAAAASAKRARTSRTDELLLTQSWPTLPGTPRAVKEPGKLAARARAMGSLPKNTQPEGLPVLHGGRLLAPPREPVRLEERAHVGRPPDGH